MHAWEQIQLTIDYMEEHLSEEMDIGRMAELAALSPFYYQRLFKRLVKKTVMEYIRLRRMAKAAVLLLQSDTRILDIALDLGFSSHEQFTRIFKDTFGMTPEAYRKNPVTLNYMTRPQLLLNYVMIDENVPLIVDGIVLEVGRRQIQTADDYKGLEMQAPVSLIDGTGVESGKDPLSEAWDTFHRLKGSLTGLAADSVELGAMYMSTQEGFFCYFAGGQCPEGITEEDRQLLLQDRNLHPDICPPSLQLMEWTNPAGEYLVCSFEAETFETLVMDVLYKANRYLYDVWIPAHSIEGEAFQMERYTKRTDHPAQMEIWIKLKQQSTLS